MSTPRNKPFEPTLHYGPRTVTIKGTPEEITDLLACAKRGAFAKGVEEPNGTPERGKWMAVESRVAQMEGQLEIEALEYEQGKGW